MTGPDDPAAADRAATGRKAGGFVLFVRAAHAVCDALEARDVSAVYTGCLALCVARARARAEEDAIESAFDIRRPESRGG